MARSNAAIAINNTERKTLSSFVIISMKAWKKTN